MLALMILLGLQGAGGEVFLTVEKPAGEAFEIGERFSLTASVELGASAADAVVTLRLPALANLRLVSMDSGVRQVRAGVEVRTLRWFRLELAPLSAGAASVGPIEVDVNAGGELFVLSSEGFTLRASEPLRWQPLLEWALWACYACAAAGLAAVAVIVLLRRRRKALTDPAVDEGEAERLKAAAEMDRLVRLGDHRRVVGAAFDVIVSEIERRFPELAASGGGIERAKIAPLAGRWKELPTAHRLGEEVRYGGYEPSAKEAAFIAGLARRILASEESGKAADTGAAR